MQFSKKMNNLLSDVYFGMMPLPYVIPSGSPRLVPFRGYRVNKVRFIQALEVGASDDQLRGGPNRERPVNGDPLTSSVGLLA